MNLGRAWTVTVNHFVRHYEKITKKHGLQSRQVKRTLKVSINELIIWKMNPLVAPVTSVKFKWALVVIFRVKLTLKMTTAQVVETSVTVNNNSPIQDYVHLDDHALPTYEMTPVFKPFTDIKFTLLLVMSNQNFVLSNQDGVLVWHNMSFQEKKNFLQSCLIHSCLVWYWKDRK